jgi:hypothetical protein
MTDDELISSLICRCADSFGEQVEKAGGCTPLPATITMNPRLLGAIIDPSGTLHIGARNESTTFGRWKTTTP